MCAGRDFFALRGWGPTEEGAAYAPGPGLRSSGGLELGWWTCAPLGVSPKMLRSRREKEDAGASGQWLRGWRPMELWGSYTGPGLHVPGMALACAEDRYSFCGTKGRGGGGGRAARVSRPSGFLLGRRAANAWNRAKARGRSVGARAAAKRDGRTGRLFGAGLVHGAARASHSAGGGSSGRTSVSSRVPVPNPNDGSETFLEFTCLPKKDTSRFSRTE